MEIHNYISNKDITYFLLLISYKFEIYYFVSYNYIEKKNGQKITSSRHQPFPMYYLIYIIIIESKKLKTN